MSAAEQSPPPALEATFVLIAAVPPAAVLGIFARYGKPLAVTMPAESTDDQRALVALPDGGAAQVRVLQLLGYGDVIPNDYFVLERSGDDAQAVPGPLFSAALAALARAAGVA